MMSRKAKIYYTDLFAGTLTEDETEYTFKYDDVYLQSPNSQPISLTFPIKKELFRSKTMFPFFDGLIPEGWLLDIAQKNWKLNPRDRMGLLLSCCKDCIGAVSVINDTGKGTNE
jgi:serine/threonine-protein kinase HipA